MEINKIHYNWVFASDGRDSGEDYQVEQVGTKNENGLPIAIEEHRPQGEGDKWFYDIVYDDGSMKRVFNPNQVFYKKINVN
jgi:hypothetical protein